MSRILMMLLVSLAVAAAQQPAATSSSPPTRASSANLRSTRGNIELGKETKLRLKNFIP